MPLFSVSTKVGYFPHGSYTEHSLDPARLREAIQRAVAELGCPPAAVLLHNPEATLRTIDSKRGRDMLCAAVEVLIRACAAGECRRWGVSAWEPASLVTVLDGPPPPLLPRPDVLMVRAGLLVHSRGLSDADRLCAALGVEPARRWGMSPFGGRADAALWELVNPRQFLTAGHQASQHGAAFRVAYELPGCERVAVSTTGCEHLTELVHARNLQVDRPKIIRYRQFLAARQSTLAD